MPVLIINTKPPEKHSLFTKIGVNSRYLTVLCVFMQVIDIIKETKGGGYAEGAGGRHH